MIPNPDLYRELDVPFESQTEANAALDGFWSDLAEARKRHRIPDVVASIRITFQDAEGEAQVFTSCEFGDVLRHEAMVAHTLGQLQSERQQRIAKLAMGDAVRKPRAK